MEIYKNTSQKKKQNRVKELYGIVPLKNKCVKCVLQQPYNFIKFLDSEKKKKKKSKFLSTLYILCQNMHY